MRKWLKESEGKVPPAETSLGTQELHKCRQQVQVGRGSWKQIGKVGSWCKNPGTWNKSQETVFWEVFHALSNPGLPCTHCWAAAPSVCGHLVVPGVQAREQSEGPPAHSLISLPSFPPALSGICEFLLSASPCKTSKAASSAHLRRCLK